MFGLNRLMGRRDEAHDEPPAKIVCEPLTKHDDGLTARQRAILAIGRCELQYKWPSEIAAEFVAHERGEGYNTYPYTSADLDEAIANFCADNGYLPQDPQTMREAVAAQPFVGPPRRQRLSKHNPLHKPLLQRMLAGGSTNDRPHLYYIRDVPADASGRPTPWYALEEDIGAASCPPPAQPQERAPSPKAGRKATRAGKTPGKPPVATEFTQERRAA